MQTLWAVFHSDECDDPAMLERGWYVAPIQPDGSMRTDDAESMTDYDEACVFVDCRNNGWTL